MIFGPLPIDQAEGAILAHSVAGLAKGRVLSAADLAQLRAAGLGQVTVARLGPGDVPENAAAQQLAQALVPDPLGQGLRLSAAGAGRVNLYATGPGILMLDQPRLAALNAVDPMITIATLPAFARLAPGGMVATIKIISYAVAQADLQRAAGHAAGSLRLLPPVLDHAVLIETTTTGTPPPDKGRRATRTRLERLGISLADRVVVPHEAQALSQAVAQAAQAARLVLVLTASATSDIQDVAPTALLSAGGTLTRFGMPVDPGNLLFLGQLGQATVVGLPGCARSPALNGADWVLERVACGQVPSSADIAAMGVGGLLKEIPTRPRPRRSPGGQ